MSSRWAMLGSQIGQGLGSGLDNVFGPRFQIKNAERTAQAAGYKLNDLGRDQLLQSIIFGSALGGKNPLMEMMMLKSLGIGGIPGMSGTGGYFDPIVKGGSTPTNDPIDNSPVKERDPNISGGMNSITVPNLDDNTVIYATDKSTGQSMKMLKKYFDSTRYTFEGTE